MNLWVEENLFNLLGEFEKKVALCGQEMRLRVFQLEMKEEKKIVELNGVSGTQINLR